jgi:hypothetical protein
MPRFDDYLDLAARLNQDKPLIDVARELVEENNEFSARVWLDLEVVRWLTEVFKLDVPRDFYRALRDGTKTLRSIMEKSCEEEEVIEDEPGMLMATKHRTLDKWSVKSK